MEERGRRILAALAVVMLTAGMAVVSNTSSAGAEVGKQALVLGSSVSGGASSKEATRATADGFTVNVVDDLTWGGMSTADFGQYQLIVVGDPTCSSTPAVVSQNATNLANAVMGKPLSGNTKAGNRVVIGTDPVFHSTFGGRPDAENLIKAGIDFAGVQEGASGLYLDLSCSDPDYDGNAKPDVMDLLLPQLSIAANTWTENGGPPCGGSVSLISNAAQFSILSSSDLQGWGCSVHESLPTFPNDWTALAVAKDTPTTPTCGNDVDTGAAVCGEAYILIAGSGIVAKAPNLALDPLTATNPVGTQHTVTATVTDPDTNAPKSGVLVNFTVTGANAGASGTCAPVSCVSDANGQVKFTYTGANPGDDTINASITVSGSTQTATAAKKWVVAADNPTTCKVTAGRAGPPKQQDVTVQDLDGIQTIGNIVITNGTVSVPSLAGQPTSVIVTATKTNQTKATVWSFDVTDKLGNKKHCV